MTTIHTNRRCGECHEEGKQAVIARLVEEGQKKLARIPQQDHRAAMEHMIRTGLKDAKKHINEYANPDCTTCHGTGHVVVDNSHNETWFGVVLSSHESNFFEPGDVLAFNPWGENLKRFQWDPWMWLGLQYRDITVENEGYPDFVYPLALKGNMRRGWVVTHESMDLVPTGKNIYRGEHASV